MRRFLVALLAIWISGLAGPTAVAGGSGPRPPITIQILNVSDWHAQLDPLVINNQLVGGAAVLSAYFEQDRAANPNSLTITAGDAFGASPPLSNFFNEEPAVLAMNEMGFSLDGLGNHNFDRGIAHLQQMIDLAEFPYLSANLANVDANLDGVEPYQIFTFGRVDVAVIGVTNPEAPTLVFPGNFGTIEVTDPVAAIQQARKRANAQGADVFVVIAHMGITSFDADGNPQGPIIDLTNALDPGDIDLVIGDHTDVAFDGVISGIPLVENASKGATYTRVNVTVNQNNRKVLDVTADRRVPLASAVTPDADVEAVLAPFRAQLQAELGVVIGSSNRFVPRADACGRGDGRLCESLVGNIVTDALRASYGTDFALTNSGGLRADLTCPTTDIAGDTCPLYTPPPFPITAGQAFAVLPFGNESATLPVSGVELKQFLENGVSAMPGANGRFPQVSGLCFTYDISAAPGNRVSGAVRQAADGSCTGAAIDLSGASTYTLATNDFVLGRRRLPSADQPGHHSQPDGRGPAQLRHGQLAAQPGHPRPHRVHDFGSDGLPGGRSLSVS